MGRRKSSIGKLLEDRARPSIEDLPLWALSQGASCFIIDLSAYETCRIAGIVQRLRLDPVNGMIEVIVSDGTGVISAKWVICRPTPQLALVPGRGVVLTGATCIGFDGEVVLTEPHFVVASIDETTAA